MLNKTLPDLNIDSTHVWHPCSQMQDYVDFPPIMVKGAKGPYIELADGRRIIDAISNWWCKPLGHQHPRLKRALERQMEKFEHVLLANTTNTVITQLSAHLAQLMPKLGKVYYASDGACAVEIALKMSLHVRQIKGESKRKRFLALENAYHGETTAALSVSDLGMYRDPYRAMLFEPYVIQGLPYVAHQQDPLWHDASAYWDRIEKKLDPLASTITALIVEPIVQGAGGMRIYSQDFLGRLCAWAQQHDIHIIADEIMTGLGRTGRMLACEYAAIEPDFLCLGKSLTGGWLPLSAVLTHDAIYACFYADWNTHKAFMHSHTFCGNALAASVALETLIVLAEEKMYVKASHLGALMLRHMQDIAQATGKLHNLRQIGAIVAADLICSDPQRRMGYEVYQHALKRGALLRPLGNTIYWLPPLNTPANVLQELKNITQAAIMASS